MGKPLRFTQAARKHKIGRGHARHVVDTVTPIVVAETDELEQRHVFYGQDGQDDRGVWLTVIIVIKDEYDLVIHCQPDYERNRR